MVKKIGIINIDDPYSKRILDAMKVKAVTYGFSKDADIRPDDIRMDINGISFKAVTPKGIFPVESKLTGKYNIKIYSLLSALDRASGLTTALLLTA